MSDPLFIYCFIFFIGGFFSGVAFADWMTE